MQPDPTTLRALADRVERGAQTTELNEAVALATGWRLVAQPNGIPDMWGAPDGVHFWRTPPRILSSLDAIEALRERELPGYAVGSHTWNDGFVCRLFRPGRDASLTSVFAPTRCAAELAALLRAIAAKVEGERA